MCNLICAHIPVCVCECILHVCLCWRQDCVATLHLLSCLDYSVCTPPWFFHGFGGGGGSQCQLGEGMVVVGSVHKKSPCIGQLINQGWFGGKRSLPAPSWLVRVCLFRVTHGQSRLTSNHQEQPQLRPSINKKCVMKVRGQTTGWWGSRGGGRRRSHREWECFLFSEIRILSFTAELTSPGTELE